MAEVPKHEGARKGKPLVFDGRRWGQVAIPYLAELKRLLPRAHDAAFGGGRGYVDVLFEHPEILVGGRTFRQALEAEQEAFEQRPPIKVAHGDFVRIQGRVFFVSGVNEDSRMVCTERLNLRGGSISSDWCSADYPDGSQLEPLAPTDREGDEWPPIPSHLKDGLDRARFVRREHSSHLARAGLAGGRD